MNIGCSHPVTPRKSQIPRISKIPKTPDRLSYNLDDFYITTSTPEPTSPQQSQSPSKVSIFDHIWSLITNEDTIPIHDLFRLLKYIEIELMSSTCIDSCFLSNDFLIKSRIVEQSEFLERVDKQHAFNILCSSLKDMKILNTKDKITRINKDRSLNGYGIIDISTNDVISEENDYDYDYDETATLMEMNQNSPLREDTEEYNQQRDEILNWVKPNLKSALMELEILHTKLNKQYSLLETDLEEIKRKNSLDMEELKNLNKSNENIYDRVSNIRDEVLNFNTYLVNYREKFHSNITMELQNDDKQVFSFLTNYDDDDDELVLQELKLMANEESLNLNWSTETTPIVEQLESNIKDNRFIIKRKEVLPNVSKEHEEEEEIDITDVESGDVTDVEEAQVIDVEQAQVDNINGIDMTLDLKGNNVNPNFVILIITLLFLYFLY